MFGADVYNGIFGGIIAVIGALSAFVGVVTVLWKKMKPLLKLLLLKGIPVKLSVENNTEFFDEIDRRRCLRCVKNIEGIIDKVVETPDEIEAFSRR